MHRSLAVALCASSLGCTDFPPIAEGECGNNVLEVGEDCDGFSAFEEGTVCGAADGVNGCFYLCDESTACPVGWGCGVDGRCRRPSGEFVAGPGSPWSFPVDDFSAGDADGDRRSDLVGVSSQAVFVRYGDELGAFDSAVELSSRAPTGAPKYGLFNDDALLDIVLPTDLGLFVLLGSEERTLEPVAYSPFSLGNAKVFLKPIVVAPPLGLLAPDFEFPNLLLVAEGSPMDGMFFIDNQAGTFDLPAETVANVVGPIAVADIDGPPPGQNTREEWAMPVAGKSTLQVFTSSGGGGFTIGISVRETILLPGPIDRGAAFADADGDGDVDLFVSYREGALSRIALSLNSGGDLANIAVHQAVFDRTSPDEVPWPLALGDFNGDQRADIIVPEGAAMAGGPPGVVSSLLPTLFSQTPFEEAAAGDFNGDGRLDFAASVVQQRGFDVFLGDGNGLFNRFHVGSDGHPVALRAGDYDGDFVQDIAFVLRARDEGQEDRLLVSFGQTSGGPTSPISMGLFASVESAEPLPGFGLFDGDMSGDLIVSSLDETTRAVAILQGSSSRRMISPFSLQRPGDVSDPSAGDYVPLQVAFGDFMSDENADVLALAVHEEDGFGPGMADPIMAAFAVPGSEADGGLSSTGVGSGILTGDILGYSCALWESSDIDGMGKDDLIAINFSTGCDSVVSPASSVVVIPNGDVASSETVVLDSIDLRAPSSSSLVDIDQDGDRDYLVVFRGDRNGDGAGVAVFGNDGAGIDLGDLTEVTVPEGRPVGAALVRLDVDPYPDLVIVTDESYYAALYSAEDATFGEPELVAPISARRVVAGDLNGDGVDDFAYLTGTEVEVMLGVPEPPLGTQQGGGQ